MNLLIFINRIINSWNYINAYSFLYISFWNVNKICQKTSSYHCDFFPINKLCKALSMIIQCSKYFFVSFNVANGLRMSRSFRVTHKKIDLLSIFLPHILSYLWYKAEHIGLTMLHKCFLFSKLIHIFPVFIGELFLHLVKEK